MINPISHYTIFYSIKHEDLKAADRLPATDLNFFGNHHYHGGDDNKDGNWNEEILCRSRSLAFLHLFDMFNEKLPGC